MEPLSPNQISVNWRDNSNNEAGFTVERSTDYGRRFTPIAVLEPGSTGYVDGDVLIGRTYRYRVYAFNDAGRARMRDSRLLRFAPPPGPQSLTAASVSASTVQLRWVASSWRATGLVIQRASDGGAFEDIAVVAPAQTEYIDAGLKPSTKYDYRVLAFDPVGRSSAGSTVSVRTLPPEVIYSGPLVITQGGVYTGNWESLDADVPAVTIRTAEPVVIENSNIRSRGDLIETDIDHARITVRETRGYGLNPEVYGVSPGRFLDATYFDSAELVNNYMEGTGGIKLLEYHGNATLDDTIRVTGNSALNIDGRKSDGNGGFLDFHKRTRLSDGLVEEGFEVRQFVQIRKAYHVPGIEIAWNQVINEPGNSRVEDNINIYKSSGTPDSPISIHDNYIQGAYNVKPWQASYSDDTWEYSWRYAGGGILVGDGSSDVAYVEAFNNQVVSTTNYGIAIASGHDMVFHHNRVVSSGLLPDGRRIAAQNVGVYIWDLYALGPTGFYNNTAHDNLIGWVNQSGTGRNDWWIPDATSFENNLHWQGDVTPAVEAAELVIWRNKVDAANMVVGPHD